jgi:hypothetical protein
VCSITTVEFPFNCGIMVELISKAEAVLQLVEPAELLFVKHGTFDVVRIF